MSSRGLFAQRIQSDADEATFLVKIVISFFKADDCLPIPEEKSMDGWKNNIIDETNPSFHEPLVPIGPYSEYPEIASNGVYFGERESFYEPGKVKGSLLTSFVRKDIAERLVEASKLLPPRCVLMTLDAHRTESVQNSLFEDYKNDLLKPPFSLNEEVAVEKTQQYVSRPSKPNSPHMTGGAVDLTIVEFKNDAAWKEYQALGQQLKNIKSDGNLDEKIEEIERRRGQLLREQAKMLDMGVAFDEVALDEKWRGKTALRYYEKKLEEIGFLPKEDLEPLKNRRLLYNVLTAVGFTFYPDEPWHVDFGDKFWAQQSGKQAFYGFIELSNENIAHEEKRRELFAADMFVQNEYETSPAFSNEVKQATNRIGNPQYSTSPRNRFAQRIRPAKPAEHNPKIETLVDRVLEKRPTFECLRQAETLGDYLNPLLTWTFQPKKFPHAETLLNFIVSEIEICFDRATAKEAASQLRQNYSVETAVHVSLPRVQDRAAIHPLPIANLSTLVFQSMILSSAAHLSAGHKLHISCSTGRINLRSAISSAAYFQPEQNCVVRLCSHKRDKTPECYLPPLTLEKFNKTISKKMLTKAGCRRANILRQAIARHPDNFSRQIVTAYSGLYDEVLPSSIRQVTVDCELFAPAFLKAVLEDQNSVVHQLFATEKGREFLSNEFSDVNTAWKKGETPFDVLETKDGAVRLTPYHGDLSPDVLCEGLRTQKLMPKLALTYLAFLCEAGLAITGGMQQTLYATQIKDRLLAWLKTNRPNDPRIESFALIPTERAVLSSLWGVCAGDIKTPLGYNEALNGWRLDKEMAEKILCVKGKTALDGGVIILNDSLCPDQSIDDSVKAELLRDLVEQGGILQVNCGKRENSPKYGEGLIPVAKFG